MKAKTALFRQLQIKLRQPQGDKALLPLRQKGISRRHFVKDTLTLGLSLGLGASGIRCGKSSGHPKIAIVGAGLAGLSAGYYLKKNNLPFTIYEGSSRVGGRIFTLPEFAAPGTWTELGGQYFDSSHRSVIELCRELNLPLQDIESPGEAALVQMDYFFEGKRYSDREIIAEFSAVAPFFEKDIASFPEVIGYRTPQFKELDQLSLAEYIDKSGTSPLIKQVLKAAFTCEYGRELSEQSSLNMIYLLPPRVNGEVFEAWGGSDERYVVEGGNNTLPEKMASLLEEHLQMEHVLEAISQNGTGYTLSFSDNKEVRADVVILAIPFTLLRKVALRIKLPPMKKQAIEELGYGMNSKMVMGFDERVWRQQGFTGNVFNERLQNAWEHTQMQNNNQGPGGFTVFLGGEAGKNLGAEHQAELLFNIDKAYPGSQKAYNDKMFLFNWNTNLFVQGSYTCYLPGQWTTFGGIEAEPVGNLYFAGEHCSLESQGFMDGAVESGKKAAEAVMKKIKVITI